MIKYTNYNDKIRKLLKRIYEEKEEEKLTNCIKFIENLKYDNTDLYNIIVGLLFVDSYQFLLLKKQLNLISFEEEDKIEIYKKINDLDDLNFVITEDSSLFFQIINSSILLDKLNFTNRIHMLTLLPDEYLVKFNPFYLLEKYELFKMPNINDLVNKYAEFLKTSDARKKNIIAEIFMIIILAHEFNFEGFNEFMSEIIDIYYTYKKNLQYTNPGSTVGLDDDILEIIEKFSWTDIINIIFQNKSFLNIIISEFLKLKTNGKIKIEDINKCFEMSIVKKVKIKLKEV